MKSKLLKKKRPFFNPKDWRDWFLHSLVILILGIEIKVIDTPWIFIFVMLIGMVSVAILSKTLKK